MGKVLRDLGNPDPPLSLELVRDLLSLDRQYYSATKVSFLQEVVHRIRLPGKQILLRPGLLLDVVRTSKLSALWLPDQKRILLDEDRPAPKQRWYEAHEITHSLLGWHAKYLLGDDDHTLKPCCHEKLESEANYGAARLLFLGDKLRSAISAESIDFPGVKKLATSFGNSITTTLWRIVEALDVPAVGVISVHPTRSGPLDGLDEPCRYLIRSKPFEAGFGGIDETQLFQNIHSYCNYKARGPLGSGEVSLVDDDGIESIFHFETFHNNYDALTLGVFKRHASLSVRPMVQLAN